MDDGSTVAVVVNIETIEDARDVLLAAGLTQPRIVSTDGHTGKSTPLLGEDARTLVVLAIKKITQFSMKDTIPEFLMISP